MGQRLALFIGASGLTYLACLPRTGLFGQWVDQLANNVLHGWIITDRPILGRFRLFFVDLWESRKVGRE